MLPRLAVAVLLCVHAASAGPLGRQGAPFKAALTEKCSSKDSTEYILKFPSPVKSPFPANDVVWGRWSVPRAVPGPYPAVLILPIMAAPNQWIESQFMKRLLRGGFAVLLLETPYQFHRRPRKGIPSGQVFLARTAKHLAFNFRQSVLDGKRALAWLRGNPQVMKNDIGILGVSLGALAGASLYSVDKTPSYAVFLLGGADFPSLVENSSMTGKFARHWGIAESALREAFSGLDPLSYRKQNGGKKALLINAAWDDVIPKENAELLREAFPSSRQMWVPLGHYGSMLHMVWLPGYVEKAFAKHLNRISGRPRPVRRTAGDGGRGSRAVYIPWMLGIAAVAAVTVKVAFASRKATNRK